MRILHIHVEKKYFDEIKSGKKVEEYREYKKHWFNRLHNKCFDKILIKCGYPKAGDTEKIIERPWRGYTVKQIQHEKFGPQPVHVFAIRVN